MLFGDQRAEVGVRVERIVGVQRAGRQRIDDDRHYLAGAREIDVAGAVNLLNVGFLRKKNMTPEYLKHLAGVQVERGLESLLKGR